MGGYGSGRRWGAARCEVENSHILNGYNLLPKLIKEAGKNQFSSGVITWSRNGQECANVGYTLRCMTLNLDYTINKEKNISYPITITTTPQPKGGSRYWFVCPLRECGRVTAKLYLPNGASYFGCRKCYNLTYESSNESHKFDAFFRRMGAGRGETLKETEKRLLEEL